MTRKILFAALTILGLCTGGFAASDPKPSVGVVNFSNCMSESKLGKQEQASFESLKNQMTALLEDTEKKLNEISAKFNDPEFMEGLSPEGEEEMKANFGRLQEEMGRYQNQYYQVLNQANMKIVQTMGANIQEASEHVAKNKKLTVIMNKDACFFHTPTLDVTNLVIAEMDKSFDKNNKKKSGSSTPSKQDKKDNTAKK